MNNMVHALIPAAGQGTRYGGATLKQYLQVAGQSVLAHSICTFHNHPGISGVTVVLAENDPCFSSAVGNLATEVDTVTGGATRAQSVRNGLQFVADHYPETEWVLVHDAARPCLSSGALNRLLKQGLSSAHGAILAVPVADTIKRGNDLSEIVATVDRIDLWAAQTPQLFRLKDLSCAIDNAIKAGSALTDEASAMEFAGKRPRLVMGSAANIKITHQDDLIVAEAWLNSVASGAQSK